MFDTKTFMQLNEPFIFSANKVTGREKITQRLRYSNRSEREIEKKRKRAYESNRKRGVRDNANEEREGCLAF